MPTLLGFPLVQCWMPQVSPAAAVMVDMRTFVSACGFLQIISKDTFNPLDAWLFELSATESLSSSMKLTLSSNLTLSDVASSVLSRLLFSLNCSKTENYEAFLGSKQCIAIYTGCVISPWTDFCSAHCSVFVRGLLTHPVYIQL